MELLICKDFHFYNNGVYKTISKLAPEGWFTDIEKVEPSIRIFGTEEQVKEAYEVYVKMTGLNLDETYDFKVEPKGSYWYDIYGKEAEEINTRTKIRLALYKEKYLKQNNNKALITTI
ncbi:MAG: hypothetical protein Unbinned6316contig1000_31 [Prokaryotic dsDNA virus sp.]|nr:MAG: hypothetical protein Unbinned6316contig1000_31 [Prokaryotic dsDNA virus sp.]|tara:strand:- start:3403 stop:3756 length:354 start_codon:yes stop_codon:yes gene_type:complete